MIVIMLATACLIFSLSGCSGRSEDDLDGYEPPEIGNLEHTNLKFLFPGSKPANWQNVKTEIEKRMSDTLNASLDLSG